MAASSDKLLLHTVASPTFRPDGKDTASNEGFFSPLPSSHPCVSAKAPTLDENARSRSADRGDGAMLMEANDDDDPDHLRSNNSRQAIYSVPAVQHQAESSSSSSAFPPALLSQQPPQPAQSQRADQRSRQLGAAAAASALASLSPTVQCQQVPPPPVTIVPTMAGALGRTSNHWRRSGTSPSSSFSLSVAAAGVVGSVHEDSQQQGSSFRNSEAASINNTSSRGNGGPLANATNAANSTTNIAASSGSGVLCFNTSNHTTANVLMSMTDDRCTDAGTVSLGGVSGGFHALGAANVGANGQQQLQQHDNSANINNNNTTLHTTITLETSSTFGFMVDHNSLSLGGRSAFGGLSGAGLGAGAGNSHQTLILDRSSAGGSGGGFGGGGSRLSPSLASYSASKPTAAGPNVPLTTATTITTPSSNTVGNASPSSPATAASMSYSGPSPTRGGGVGGGGVRGVSLGGGGSIGQQLFPPRTPQHAPSTSNNPTISNPTVGGGIGGVSGGLAALLVPVSPSNSTTSMSTAGTLGGSLPPLRSPQIASAGGNVGLHAPPLLPFHHPSRHALVSPLNMNNPMCSVDGSAAPPPPLHTSSASHPGLVVLRSSPPTSSSGRLSSSVVSGQQVLPSSGSRGELGVGGGVGGATSEERIAAATSGGGGGSASTNNNVNALLLDSPCVAVPVSPTASARLSAGHLARLPLRLHAVNGDSVSIGSSPACPPACVDVDKTPSSHQRGRGGGRSSPFALSPSQANDHEDDVVINQQVVGGEREKLDAHISAAMKQGIAAITTTAATAASLALSQLDCKTLPATPMTLMDGTPTDVGYNTVIVGPTAARHPATRATVATAGGGGGGGGGGSLPLSASALAAHEKQLAAATAGSGATLMPSFTRMAAAVRGEKGGLPARAEEGSPNTHTNTDTNKNEDDEEGRGDAADDASSNASSGIEDAPPFAALAGLGVKGAGIATNALTSAFHQRRDMLEFSHVPQRPFYQHDTAQFGNAAMGQNNNTNINNINTNDNPSSSQNKSDDRGRRASVRGGATTAQSETASVNNRTATPDNNAVVAALLAKRTSGTAAVATTINPLLVRGGGGNPCCDSSDSRSFAFEPHNHGGNAAHDDVSSGGSAAPAAALRTAGSTTLVAEPEEAAALCCSRDLRITPSASHRGSAATVIATTAGEVLPSPHASVSLALDLDDVSMTYNGAPSLVGHHQLPLMLTKVATAPMPMPMQQQTTEVANRSPPLSSHPSTIVVAAAPLTPSLRPTPPHRAHHHSDIAAQVKKAPPPLQPMTTPAPFDSPPRNQQGGAAATSGGNNTVISKGTMSGHALLGDRANTTTTNNNSPQIDGPLIGFVALGVFPEKGDDVSSGRGSSSVEDPPLRCGNKNNSYNNTRARGATHVRRRGGNGVSSGASSPRDRCAVSANVPPSSTASFLDRTTDSSLRTTTNGSVYGSPPPPVGSATATFAFASSTLDGRTLARAAAAMFSTTSTSASPASARAAPAGGRGGGGGAGSDGGGGRMGATTAASIGAARPLHSSGRLFTPRDDNKTVHGALLAEKSANEKEILQQEEADRLASAALPLLSSNLTSGGGGSSGENPLCCVGEDNFFGDAVDMNAVAFAVDDDKNGGGGGVAELGMVGLCSDLNRSCGGKATHGDSDTADADEAECGGDELPPSVAAPVNKDEGTVSPPLSPPSSMPPPVVMFGFEKMGDRPSLLFGGSGRTLPPRRNQREIDAKQAAAAASGEGAPLFTLKSPTSCATATTTTTTTTVRSGEYTSQSHSHIEQAQCQGGGDAVTLGGEGAVNAATLTVDALKSMPLMDAFDVVFAPLSLPYASSVVNSSAASAAGTPLPQPPAAISTTLSASPAASLALRGTVAPSPSPAAFPALPEEKGVSAGGEGHCGYAVSPDAFQPPTTNASVSSCPSLSSQGGGGGVGEGAVARGKHISFLKEVGVCDSEEDANGGGGAMKHRGGEGEGEGEDVGEGRGRLVLMTERGPASVPMQAVVASLPSSGCSLFPRSATIGPTSITSRMMGESAEKGQPPSLSGAPSGVESDISCSDSVVRRATIGHSGATAAARATGLASLSPSIGLRRVHKSSKQ